jgi:hypothetical protein
LERINVTVSGIDHWFSPDFPAIKVAPVDQSSRRFSHPRATRSSCCGIAWTSRQDLETLREEVAQVAVFGTNSLVDTAAGAFVGKVPVR